MAKEVSILEKRYDTNPYIGTRAQYKRARKRTVIKGGKMVVDSATGEIEDTAELVTTHEVDGEQFVKLYTKELKLLFSLSPSAMKVLQVVLQQVQGAIGKDTILLNMAIVEKYFKTQDAKPVPRTTFYRCVKEMIKKGFIAPATDSRDLFFINPNLFFNGDRVRLVTEYHIKRQDSMIPEESGLNALESPTENPKNNIDEA